MIEVIPKRVLRTEVFDQWHRKLADQVAKGAIAGRIERIQNGLYGDIKDLKDGVCEARVDVGAGYRVYYTETGDTIVVLLMGGNKSSQKGDIRTAKKMLNDMVAQQQRHRKQMADDSTAAAEKNDTRGWGSSRRK